MCIRDRINADIYCVFSAGTISAYRGKLIFGHYEILTGEKRSIFKAVRILNIVWYIEGIKMVLSKNAKLANKQKSTFDKANKNKGFSKVQQFPRIEEITKMSKKRSH